MKLAEEDATVKQKTGWCRGKFKRRFVAGTKGDSVRGRIFRGYRASGGVEAGAGEALPRTGFGDDR
jgi:hypothetical protein